MSRGSGQRSDARPAARLARGAALVAEGDFAGALPLVSSPSFTAGSLGAYAQYYTGVAMQGLDRLPEADTALTALVARRPDGVLKEAGLLRLAEVALARGDSERAENLLETLSAQKLSAPEDVFLALGRAEEARDHRDHALAAYRRVYYDFALSRAGHRGAGRHSSGSRPSQERRRRASRASWRAPSSCLPPAAGHRRAPPSQPLARAAQGGTAALVALRLAECDYYLDRHRAAARRPPCTSRWRRARSRSALLSPHRDARPRRPRRLRDAGARPRRRPCRDNEWAAETLNNLASHYIQIDDDAERRRRLPRAVSPLSAASLFGARRLAHRVACLPQPAVRRDGSHLRRRRRRVFRALTTGPPGCTGRPGLTISSTIASPPTPAIVSRLPTIATRTTVGCRRRFSKPGASRSPPNTVAVSVAPPPAVPAVPTEALIRELVAGELYHDALQRTAVRAAHVGRLPLLQATVAWVRHQQGLELKATERFLALRGAITTMRRAYPQFLAAGGEAPAARRPAHHLPARLLAAHQEICGSRTSSTRF